MFLLVISAGILIIWRGNPQYFSPLFLVIPAFLFLSISFCIVKRILAQGGAWDAKFLGSFVFHLGLLMVIASTALGPLTRFWATVVLPQGMAINLEDKAFAIIHSIPIGGATPFISLRLNSQETVYEEGRFPIDYNAKLTIGFIEQGNYIQTNEVIRVNGPIWKHGYQLLLATGGYSPLFVLKNNKGETLFSEFVNVSDKTDMEDKVEMSDANVVVYTRFFPDFYKQGNKYGSRSPYPRNPAFGLRITGKDDPFKDIWRGVLKNGEKAEFEGLTLEFADLKQVVTLQVMNDPTYYGIIAGWVLIVAGLMLRYTPLQFLAGVARRNSNEAS